MSLAAVLVKPQVFVEPPAEVKGDELQLIADIISALARNPQVAQAVGEIVADEFNNQMRAFLVSREERLRFAYGKGRNIFSPFETAIQTLINDLQDDIFEAIPTILSLAKQMADGLSLNGVKSFIGDLWDLAENDLEISGDALRQLVNTLFAGVIARLQQPFNDGDSSDDAIAQYDFGCTVDNLRAFVMDELVIPRIDKQLVLEAVTKIWQQYKIDENLQTVSQVLAAGEEIITPLSEIAQCIIKQIETSSNTDRSNPVPLSDNRSFAGSAKWGSVSTRDNDSSETTPQEDENTTMAWYASWVAGRNVKYSSDTTQPLNIYDNPELMGFTYENISRETMERIAFHTAWIVPLLETIPHLASLEKKDIWSNLTNIFANGIDSLLIGWPKFNLPKWAHWTGLPIYTMLAGFEGHEGRWEMPGDDDPYIWTNILGDVGEAYMYRRISWTAREALLSILTLVNNNQQQAQTWREQASEDGELTSKQIELAWIRRNNNCFQGLAYFFGELLVMMVPGIISAVRKRNYGFIGGGPSTQTWVCGFVGAGVTWGLEYLFGAMFGHGLSGEWFNNRLRFAFLPLRERSVRGLFFSDLWGPDEFIADLWRRTGEQSWWEILLLSLPMGLYTAFFGGIGMGMRVVDSLLYLYLFTDGDTEDGTYCLDPNGIKRSYPGYPDAATSPYLLPWESGTDKQCVQNNMGIWSHFPKSSLIDPHNNQTYAYDFSHNMGDLVLCSRAGVVRTARDSTPSHGAAPTWGWNFIEIIHVIVILPGTAPPAGVTPHQQVDSPYTGPRPFTDPAPAASPAGGLIQYPETTIDIPLDVVFPVYPDNFSPPYRQSAAFEVGTSFAFLDPAYDRGIRGKTFSAGSTFNDGTTIPNNVVFVPDVTGQPAPRTNHPEGTTFIPSTAASGNFTPLTATFGVYGHGQGGFIPRVFGTPGTALLDFVEIPPGVDPPFGVERDPQVNSPYTGPRPFTDPAPAVPPAGGLIQYPGTTTDIPLDVVFPNYPDGPRPYDQNSAKAVGTSFAFIRNCASEILGEFVQQGQAIMEADDTGRSAYNHLHMHVVGVSQTQFTIPFVFRNVGQVKAMTYYTSTNTKVT